MPSGADEALSTLTGEAATFMPPGVPVDVFALLITLLFLLMTLLLLATAEVQDQVWSPITLSCLSFLIDGDDGLNCQFMLRKESCTKTSSRTGH